MRVLALDYGSARCGCALSDPTGTLATPIDPIERPATRRGFARRDGARPRARRRAGRRRACRSASAAPTPTRRARRARSPTACAGARRRAGRAVRRALHDGDRRARPGDRAHERGLARRRGAARGLAGAPRRRERGGVDEPPSDGNGEPSARGRRARPRPQRAGPRRRRTPARNGHDDPQATQPFDPVGAPTVTRRTVSLPRPQTDTGEWDAPIGTRPRQPRRRRGRRRRPLPGAAGCLRLPAVPQARGQAAPPLAAAHRRRPRAAARGRRVLRSPSCSSSRKHGAGARRGRRHGPRGGDRRPDRRPARRQAASSARAFFFSLRARLSGDRGKLRSGRYTLREGMSYGAALAALTTAPKAAPVVEHHAARGPVAARGGGEASRRRASRATTSRAAQRSPRLDPRDYGAPRATTTLEGFLFPATYELQANQATAGRLVAAAARTRSRTTSRKVDMRRGQAQEPHAATTCSSSPR